MTISSNPKIVTEKIDITTTREYIALCELYQDRSIQEEDLVQVEEELYKTNSIAKKKELLVCLAHSKLLEAHGIIKKYFQHCEADLKDWAALALNECAMLLKSSAIDDDQMMILSPAGGSGNLLRYYIALHSYNHTVFSKTQLTQLQNKIEQSAEALDCVIEAIDGQSRYVLCTCLISFDDAPDTVIKNIVSYCNQSKMMMCSSYYVTNIQKPTVEQLNEYMDSIKEQQ